MSKESDFRKMIHNEEDPVRDKIWSNIKGEMYSGTDVLESQGDTVAVSKTFNKTKFWLWTMGIFLLFVGGVLTTYFVWGHFQVPQIRYCTINEYHIEETDQTIKEYSAEKNNAFSYIDWYDESGYVYVQQFKLNENDEIICVYEQAVMENDIFCNLYVTDNKTEIDVLSFYTTACSQQSKLSQTNVEWNISSTVSYAMLEYQQNKYYLEIEGNISQDYLFNLINRLIESK